MKTRIFDKTLMFVLAFALFCCSFFYIPSVSADDSRKVRVGWYQSERFQEGADESSCKEGYAYEYLQNVSNFTGWEYEYVYGDWAELYNMFLNGDIDLMAGLSFSEERESLMLFPKYEMGYEAYHLYKRVDDRSISANDLSTLSSKKVGCLTNNLMTDYFKLWMDETGVVCKEVYFDGFEDRDAAFFSGEIDAIIGSNNNFSPNSGCSPVAEVGQSSYYLAVTKDRTDLLNQLNSALSSISEINPYFTDSLQVKYFHNTAVNAALSAEEQDWITAHDSIRVGYIEDYFPFCGLDENGKVTGVITDVFDEWQRNLDIVDQLDIDYIGYSTSEDMLSALREDEIDVAFPVADSIWMSEQNGIVQTNNLIESAVSVIYKGEYNSNITDVIAISNHGAFQEAIAAVNYPDSEIYTTDSAEGCLNAVLSGKATCTIFNSGRAEQYLSQGKYESLKATTLSEGMSYCMAVRKGNTTVYSLVERGIYLMDKTQLTDAIYQYINTNADYSLADFVHNNALPVTGVLSVLFVAIFIALFTYISASRKEIKAIEQQKQQLDIITSLSKDYENVYIVNAEKETGITLKLDGYVSEELVNGFERELPYYSACKNYVQNRVYEGDKEMMLEAMKLENVLAHVRRGEEYVGTYRVVGDEEIHYYRYKYISTGNQDQIIAGFQNVDDIVKEQEDQKKKLQEALAAAEKASKAKTSFLFNMSHDIRTPMNAILGFTDLAKKHPNDPDRLRDYLHKIRSSGNVLMSILNNILEMARIESGSIDLDEQAVDLEEIGEDLFSIFQTQMEQKGINFTKEINIQHRHVYGDQTKIREIFLNILSNAFKYTESGGKVHILLEEMSSDREGYAVFRTQISDTGIGMPPEFLDRIFDEFSRERNSEKNNIEGTGLGMAIVKRFVDLMGGRIEVQSEQGKGSAFTVTLPHRITSKDDIASDAIQQDINKDFTGKKILLAEDNDLNAEIASEILSDVGFGVERAGDGQICVDMLSNQPAHYYDVILMDVQMPNLNGYGATKKIRNLNDKEKAGIPIIAMTANAFDEDRKEAIAAGMNAHVAKPIDISKLMETLSELL